MVTSIAAVLVNRFVTELNISSYGHTLLAFSLGFLLVFRSNQVLTPPPLFFLAPLFSLDLEIDLSICRLIVVVLLLPAL